MLEVALADPGATAVTLRSACEEVLAVGQQQEQLIEALLTLARSQRGLDHQEPFDLAEVTARVLNARRQRAQALALDVTAELAPAPATGDPSLAERLMANLTDNALSYNVPGGHVEMATGTTNGHAFLRMANTGPPVPAGQVQRLLQPFQRLNPDRAAQAGGSGLGLSIVAAIVKAHGAVLSARPGHRRRTQRRSNVPTPGCLSGRPPAESSHPFPLALNGARRHRTRQPVTGSSPADDAERQHLSKRPNRWHRSRAAAPDHCRRLNRGDRPVPRLV